MAHRVLLLNTPDGNHSPLISGTQSSISVTDNEVYNTLILNSIFNILIQLLFIDDIF